MSSILNTISDSPTTCQKAANLYTKFQVLNLKGKTKRIVVVLSEKIESSFFKQSKLVFNMQVH